MENKNLADQFLSRLKLVLPSETRKNANGDLEKPPLFEDPAFLSLMKVSPTVIVVFSYANMTYEYFSPNVEDLLGYSMDHLKGISGSEFALNTFYPEHLNALIKKTDDIKKFYFECAQQKKVGDSRCTMTAKLKKANGEYIWTMQQTMVLELTPDGFPLRTIIFVSDISGIKTNDKVDFVFAVKDKIGAGYETIHMSSFSAIEEYILSDREIEILNHTRKGLRNQEIAEVLNISVK